MNSTGPENKDISKKSPEQEIRNREEEYKILHEVAQILHNADGLQDMLREVLLSITRFEELKVEHKAGVFLADEERKVLKLFCTVGEFTREFMDKEKEIPYGQCLCGRAAVSGNLLVSDSCFTDQRHENKFEGMTAHGHYIVPLKSRETLVGVLFLYTDENPPWYARSQEILLSIGGLIADGIVSRRREDEIRQKNEQLQTLNETKNKFLGIASHDLRNPIYMVRSFSEVLRDGTVGPVNEKQQDLLGRIFKASNFMTGLLENLLDISKIESGKIELDKRVQDLNATAKEQVELNQLIADKKNIRLDLQLGNTQPLSYDQNAITQVMGNFIGNAIKFSPPGTTVTISTEQEGESVRFSVRDEGPGLSEEDQQNLFQEFQPLSAKPTGGEKSTGLGLAIVKKLIHLHNGQVGVDSTLGKGSTFFFTLPMA